MTGEFYIEYPAPLPEEIRHALVLNPPELRGR